MRTALILFLIFPFSRILPLESYNQPYALILAGTLLILTPSLYRQMPNIDRFLLSYLAALGFIMLALSATSGLGLREAQYFLSYLSPLLIVPATLNAMERNPDYVARLLSFGLAAWICVGLVQLTIAPTFLQFLVSSSDSLATDIVASGRGVLSLASEPTHHGFQVLVLAATLLCLRPSLWLPLSAVMISLVLSRSASTVMILGLGAVVWAVLRPTRWLLLAGCLVLIAQLALIAVGTAVIIPETRIGSLLRFALDEPGNILHYDASVNNRVYGVISPVVESLSQGLLPIGISHESWLAMRRTLLMNNPNIIFLSTLGPASGYGLLVVQAGLFALPIIAYICHHVFIASQRSVTGIIMCSAFLVFGSQISLATPSFSLLLAASIFSVHHRFAGARKAHVDSAGEMDGVGPASTSRRSDLLADSVARVWTAPWMQGLRARKSDLAR